VTVMGKKCLRGFERKWVQYVGVLH